MSKKKVGIIIGVIAAAVVAAGVGFYFLKGRSSGGNSADKVYVEKVSAIMNQSAGINNRYSGVVEPQETLEINKDSERKVKEVYVSVGDEVEEGTVLFSYDTEELQMQIDQAKLEMEGIANDISNSNAQIAELQKNLDQYNSSNAAQEGLEEVREGAKKLSEQAKGVAIAYESSAETLDYHMEQEERQQEAKAILDQMKNARK